ncbi:hypothetical protein FRC08_017527 [Ceratobasidium sp. 394]|nr:hypothetical protein FRC08_017527 [Ceratobasidium sp. 394]
MSTWEHFSSTSPFVWATAPGEYISIQSYSGMPVEHFNQTTLVSAAATVKPSKRRRNGKACLLSDEDWFSEDFIQRSEGLYRCLVCPRAVRPSLEWKNRNNMIQHHKTAIHYRFLELAKAKKRKEQASNKLRLALYYPTVSPEEPVGNATAVVYEPDWLTGCRGPERSAGGASVPRRGTLELLEQDDSMEVYLQSWSPVLKS